MTEQEEKLEIIEGKVWAMMGYLWILCLIPLIKKRDNKFAYFHARQGLILFLMSILFSSVAFLPFFHFLGALGNLAVMVFCIIGLFKALMGKYWLAPLIGSYAEKVDL